MKNNNHNFVFFGTPGISVKTLDILKQNNFLPSLIVTNPDAHSGRGMHLSATPVGIWAKENKIPCLKPEKIDSEFIKELLKFSPKFSPKSDLGLKESLSIVVAYGKILPEELINLPKFGTINIHYSLLPKYRGASPVEQAILNGDTETGISIQQMRFELDSGPIIAQEKTLIDPNENKITLLDKLVLIGGNLLVKILPDIFEGKIELKEQEKTQIIRCGKIKKEEGLLNLNDNPLKNYNKYRAFFGYPGTYFFKKNKRYKITKAKFENNKFIIEKIIPEGKKEIIWEKF